MKIYPFATLCWFNKDENIWPSKFFSQLLKTNLLSETTISQAQPAFASLNSAILTVEQCAKKV